MLVKRKLLIIGNGFDKAHGINIEWKDFVRSFEFRKGMKTYLKYFNDKEYKLLLPTKKILWSNFEDFCYLITNKYPTINKNIFYKNISKSFQNWFKNNYHFESLKKICINKSIKQFFKTNNFFSVLSFNFTNTAGLYGFKPLYGNLDDSWPVWNIETMKKRVINLHYCINKVNVFIVGSDREQTYNKSFLIEDWNDKDSINHKKVYLEKIINENYFQEIVFFGFSFGFSDKDVAIFIFNYYKKNHKITIYDKDIKQVKNNIRTILKGKRGIVQMMKLINFISI